MVDLGQRLIQVIDEIGHAEAHGALAFSEFEFAVPDSGGVVLASPAHP